MTGKDREPTNLEDDVAVLVLIVEKIIGILARSVNLNSGGLQMHFVQTFVSMCPMNYVD